MVYSEEEKDILFKLKDNGDSWETIGIALNKNKDAVRMWWERNASLRDLPPKVVARKRLTDGRVGLIIKKTVSENPKISVRQLQSKLKEYFDEVGTSPSRLPKKTAIDDYLIRNKLVVVKLLKKPLMRAANKEKRLSFS